MTNRPRAPCCVSGSSWRRTSWWSVNPATTTDTVAQVRALTPDVVILDAVTVLLDAGPASALLAQLDVGWVVVVV